VRSTLLLVFRGEIIKLCALEGHVPIPLPGFSIVRRKRLTPDWTIGVGLIPFELDDDLFSFENISCVEDADVAIEGAY
jgi:hypothetical protein